MMQLVAFVSGILFLSQFVVLVQSFWTRPASSIISSSGSQWQRREILKAVWRDAKVSIIIPVNREKVYDLYSSLNEHPTWSPWLHNVDYDRSSGLSIWTLKSLGLTFSWNANNTLMESPNAMQWESLSGFENKGRVDFADYFGEEVSSTISTTLSDTQRMQSKGTKVSQVISYNLPQTAVTILDSMGPAAENFISETLLGDLRRFKARVLKEAREEKMSEFRKTGRPKQIPLPK